MPPKHGGFGMSPTPPAKTPTSRMGSAASKVSATARLTKGSGLPVSLAGDGTKALLAQAALENKQDAVKMQKLHAIYEQLLKLPGLEGIARVHLLDEGRDAFDAIAALEAIAEQLLKLPGLEGIARVHLLDEGRDAFDAIAALEAIACCVGSETVLRRNIGEHETSDWQRLAVESAATIAALRARSSSKAVVCEQETRKKLVTRTLVVPGEDLASRIIRRKQQADTELAKKEGLVHEDMKRLDSSALARKNLELARQERNAQLDSFRAEVDKLLHEPATKDTVDKDLARLAEIQSKRLALVQKESLASANRKDVRGDHRAPWEKYRDSLIDVIDKRIKRLVEIEARHSFREEEERMRLERARKLKGIDIAVLTGEKSVLEAHHKRELELAQLEADAFVDEMLYRHTTNATGKEFHDGIREHEKAFLNFNKKMVALHPRSPSADRHRLPDIYQKNGWCTASPRRLLPGLIQFTPFERDA